ncbi:MAG: proton-conducting transporter membrane subunit [Candidatus Nezhaarchaeota archaeon]|nr:proton-conducting transporter membrane subunit [Candidatus Nezhaarchaeota archaeon]
MPLHPLPIHIVALPPILGVGLAFTLRLASLVVKDRRVWEAYAAASTLLIFALCSAIFYMAFFTSDRPLVYIFGGWPPPVGIVYEVDRLNALLGLLVAGVTFLATVYSVRYMEKDDGAELYYTLLLGFEAGMLGCLYTGDFFNLFVMLEVMSVSAYGLVAFRRDTYEAVEAAMKYAIVGSVATTIYFIAVAFGYGSFGTLNMADLASKIQGGPAFPVTGGRPQHAGWVLGAGVFMALMFWAFAIKAAIAPNHFWLPDAHPAAPSPISALLSGIMVKVAIYVILRFFFTVARGAEELTVITTWLGAAAIVLGAVSALLGAFMLVVQSDIKRLIAYGTILNIGYISMGLGVSMLPQASLTGLVAAVFHIINHGVAKALLFLCAGAFIHAAGARSLDDLAGVGRYMPWTSASLVVGALALSGVPPLNCFMSKLLLVQAFLEAGWLLPAVVIVVLTSALSLLGYLKAAYNVYFRAPARPIEVREAPGLMLAPILTLASLCVLLGVLSPWVIDWQVGPAVLSAVDSQGFISAALEVANLLSGGGA